MIDEKILISLREKEEKEMKLPDLNYLLYCEYLLGYDDGQIYDEYISSSDDVLDSYRISTFAWNIAIAGLLQAEFERGHHDSGIQT